MTDRELTLGSLFDGSGGFPLGGLISGITPVWASEIEPFPIRVTTKRLPQLKHYGDVSKMDGGMTEPVDIITFGSPCQDMSIAGKRSGLDGSRSSLFYEAIRIVKEMRCATNGKYPRYIVWENVPGAFTSNKGEDFRCVLESICHIKDASVSIPKPRKWQHAGCVMGDGYSIAWRQLDAQYFGVPQRRKRIYLVADLAGERAGKILFESEGLSGYSAQGFRSWQRAAGGLEESPDASGGLRRNDCRCFDVRFTSEGTRNARQNCYETTTSRTIDTGGNTPDSNQGGVAVVAFGICAKNSYSMKSDNPKNGFYKAETSRTLDGNGGNPACNQGGIAVVAIEGNGSRPSHRGNGYSEDDVSFTLNATEHHGVAYGIDRASFNMGQNAQFGMTVTEETEPTIVAKGPGAVAHPVYTTSKSNYHAQATEDVAGALVASDYKDPPTVANEPDYIVRRLTPTECARLQGFPDWWCANLGTENPTEEELRFWEGVFETWRLASSPKGRPKTRKQIEKWLYDPHTDSAEYKLWGNGVALPCVVFVLSGIAYFDSIDDA